MKKGLKKTEHVRSANRRHFKVVLPKYYPNKNYIWGENSYMQIFSFTENPPATSTILLEKVQFHLPNLDSLIGVWSKKVT